MSLGLREELLHRGLLAVEQPALAWVLGLITVEVLVFGLAERLTGSQAKLIGWGAAQVSRIAAGEVWRLLTPLFLHSGWSHLAANMLALLVLGGLLLGLVGPWRLYGLFLGAGLIGNLGSFLFRLVRGAGEASSIGASGAVMGLLGALVVLSLRVPPRLRGPGRKPWQVVLAGAVLYVLFTGTAAHSDHAAHLFGLLGGALLAWSIRRSPGEPGPAAGSA